MALNIPKVLDTNIFPTSRASAEGAGSADKSKQKTENEQNKLIAGSGINLTEDEDENEVTISNSAPAGNNATRINKSYKDTVSYPNSASLTGPVGAALETQKRLSILNINALKASGADAMVDYWIQDSSGNLKGKKRRVKIASGAEITDCMSFTDLSDTSADSEGMIQVISGADVIMNANSINKFGDIGNSMEVIGLN